MDQQTAPPAPVTAQPKVSKFPKLNKKTIIIILGFAILILLIPLIFLSSKKPSEQPEPPKAKTWEIILNYDNKINALTFKKLSILNQEINADFRSATYSPYELVVTDKEERALFRTKISIAEQIIYNIWSVDATTSANLIPPPTEINTTLHIPYKPSATKITINKNYSPVLQINIPPEIAFNFISEASAQTSPSSCGPLQIVFISDGYTNMAQFHSDADRIKNAFATTQPYAPAASQIFDFKTIDNTENLGCKSGIVQTSPYNSGCLQNPRIKQIGFQNFPNASKFIVLVNNPNAAAVDGGILGVANDIGGDVGIFTNRTDIPPQEYTKTAVHEVLGHMVGQLYDRYIYPTFNGQSKMLIPNLNSNCTVNPQGEQFWKQFGSTNISQGCTNPSAYTPFPRDCGNNGNSSTIMSAASCSASGFDSVEQAWISQRIIPLYQTSCTQPTNAPIPTKVLANSTSVSINPTSPKAAEPISTTGNYTSGYPGSTFVSVTQCGYFFKMDGVFIASGSGVDSLGGSFIGIDCSSYLSGGSYTVSVPGPLSVGNHIAEFGWNASYTCNDINGNPISPGCVDQGEASITFFAASNPTPAPTSTSTTAGTSPTPVLNSPTPTISGSNSTSDTKIYTCEEVPASGGSGSQVQIKTLNCH